LNHTGQGGYRGKVKNKEERRKKKRKEKEKKGKKSEFLTAFLCVAQPPFPLW